MHREWPLISQYIIIRCIPVGVICLCGIANFSVGLVSAIATPEGHVLEPGTRRRGAVALQQSELARAARARARMC